MTTGADLARARRAFGLIEAGAIEYLQDIEAALVNSMAARFLADELTAEQASHAWARLAELRLLRADLERRAKLLSPVNLPVNGGPHG